MEYTCKVCKNVRLHYIKYERGNYRPLSYGHCVKPRLKKREANTKACECFEAAAKDNNRL